APWPGSRGRGALDSGPGGRADRRAFRREARPRVVGRGNGQIAILRVPAAAPEYAPGLAAKLPTPAELAKRPAAADALKRADVPEELLRKAGRGPVRAPPELVAEFGEDRWAGGDGPCHLCSVAVTPDGKTLAFGGTDKVVRLIDLATGKQRQGLTWRLRSAADDVYTLAFCPDGKVLACGTTAGSILLWDVAAGGVPRELIAPGPRVHQVAFSPDGTPLASVGENQGGVVRLWK